MAFTLLNEAAAGFTDQAELDAAEFDIIALGFQRVGVIAGCAVTAQGTPDLTLAVASGTVQVVDTIATVSAGNVTITAAHATHPRFDLVVASNAGVKSVTAGTPAANAVYPAVPANSVVLAAVYVPANDTAIATNQITDKRVILPTNVVSGGYLAVGTNPAQSGAVRLANTAWITGRNAANNGDYNLWRLNSGDWLEQGGYLYYEDSADNFIDRGAVHHIRHDAGLTTSVKPTLSILTKSYGDNTTFIGSSGISVVMADPSDVANGTKGVLYGVAISIIPGIARNNVPFDDTAGVVVQNDGVGKGTDAYYLGEGGSVVGGVEWITGYLSNAPVNYHFRATNDAVNGLKLDEATLSGPAILLANEQTINLGSVDGNALYILRDSSRFFKFVKPTGITGSSLNSAYRFETIGGIDSINPFWNGFQFGGHGVTDGGTPFYPSLTVYSRSTTATDPTDYEFVSAIANAGTDPMGNSFATTASTGSFIRFGFGDGVITTEGMRLKYTGSAAYLGVGVNDPVARLHIGGTVTDPSSAAIILAPTLVIGSTGKALITSQSPIQPTANIAEVYGMLFIPTLIGVEGETNKAVTAQITGLTARIDTAANYDSNIAVAAPFKALHPSQHLGGGTMTRYAGYHSDINTGTARVTEAWQIFAEGNAPSYFGGNIQLAAVNLVLDATTGTKFGTATTQKIGFFNATPIVQPSSTTDLRTALINLGLYATGGASPLDLNGGALTTANHTFADAANIILNATTGTKIGTATTQKLAFFNSTPIVQPANTTDLRVALINLGLYATGGASPLDLNGGAFVTSATGAFGGALIASSQYSVISAAATVAGIFRGAASTDLFRFQNSGSTQVAKIDVLGNHVPASMTANHTAVAVNANSTADQSLMSFAVPAGALNQLGKTLQIHGAGLYTTVTGQTPTFRIKVKLGSLTLLDWISTATTAAQANMPWNFFCSLITSTIGASGKLEAHGSMTVKLGTGAQNTAAAATTNDNITAESSTIDLTAGATLQITVTFSTNGATPNTASQRLMVVNTIN